MRHCYLILSFIIISGSVLAQKPLTMKQKRQFDAANIKFEETDYRNALSLYEEIYKSNNEDAELSYKIGVCKFKTKLDQEGAITYFENAATKNFVDAYYYLGKIYHLNERFDDAVSMFNKFKNAEGTTLGISKEEVDRLTDISLRAKRVIGAPIDYKINNIGEKINTKYPDYVPLISADESVMIFTSRREGSTGGEKDPYGQFFEDIYVSYKKDNDWSHAENIGSVINNETHNACVGLSADGNVLIVYKTNEELTGGDLYWSEFNGKTWSSPTKYNENINSGYQEASASLSTDGNTMYFSSNRPGGYGGKDIYRVIRFGNGDWSKAINLGSIINTPYDDDAPFIHPDGKTLYFSSTGHRTMGGYDIFRTTLSETGDWSDPENLGYPINTVDDDIYFVESADGKTGYYSSVKPGGFGSHDIYTVGMVQIPNPVVRGEVCVNDSTKAPIKAKVTLFDVEENKVYGIYHSSALHGGFIMVIPTQKTFKVTVQAKGFESQTREVRFDTREMAQSNFLAIRLIPTKQVNTEKEEE